MIARFLPSAETRQRATRRARRTAKRPYHFIARSGPDDTRIAFILGCMRSGTTLMTRLFDQDWKASVYREKSVLSSKDTAKRLRLDPLPEVNAVLDRNHARLIVAKPLVESQNATALLDGVPNSRAIWLYRRYEDVASSYVRKWGPGHSERDLRSIVEARPNDWRYEHVSDELRGFVADHFSEGMNPYDASALFWLARNQVFFDVGLQNEQRLTLCRYETLASDPVGEMKRIYAFLDVEFPGAGVAAGVHTQAIRPPDSFPIDAEIRSRCEDLLARLDAQFDVQIGVGGG